MHHVRVEKIFPRSQTVRTAVLILRPSASAWYLEWVSTAEHRSIGEDKDTGPLFVWSCSPYSLH